MPRRKSHEWTQYELNTLVCLMAKQEHTSSALNLATELNTALHTVDVNDDIDKREIQDMVQEILLTRPAFAKMLSRHRILKITRVLKRSFERALYLSGDLADKEEDLKRKGDRQRTFREAVGQDDDDSNQQSEPSSPARTQVIAADWGGGALDTKGQVDDWGGAHVVLKSTEESMKGPDEYREINASGDKQAFLLGISDTQRAVGDLISTYSSRSSDKLPFYEEHAEDRSYPGHQLPDAWDWCSMRHLDSDVSVVGGGEFRGDDNGTGEEVVEEATAEIEAIETMGKPAWGGWGGV
ncbi:MAG: hypothetical protein M1827_002567 [Pycnora praestabilis]|nr:MAG: hypothetical protein M1827_002567 [Pycnora praestabilis]